MAPQRLLHNDPPVAGLTSLTRQFSTPIAAGWSIFQTGVHFIRQWRRCVSCRKKDISFVCSFSVTFPTCISEHRHLDTPEAPILTAFSSLKMTTSLLHHVAAQSSFFNDMTSSKQNLPATASMSPLPRRLTSLFVSFQRLVSRLFLISRLLSQRALNLRW